MHFAQSKGKFRVNLYQITQKRSHVHVLSREHGTYHCSRIEHKYCLFRQLSSSFCFFKIIFESQYNIIIREN